MVSKISENKYDPTFEEVLLFNFNSILLKGALEQILVTGAKRLVSNMLKFKESGYLSYDIENPPYEYNVKNLYINASNELWYHYLWNYRHQLSEIYYEKLLQVIKNFEKEHNYSFNKGIVYANLGVAQATQMKLDDGFANIMKAIIQDKGYLKEHPEEHLFENVLYKQFENEYFRKELKEIADKFQIDCLNSEEFIDKLLKDLNYNQRIFFEYTFMRIVQNLRNWEDMKNEFSANRLLAYAQDLCLFAEDYLRCKVKKLGQSSISIETLHPLLKSYFKIDLKDCSAKNIEELDQKLKEHLDLKDHKERCLKILLTIRNFTSHNLVESAEKGFFYENYKEILGELIRSVCYIYDCKTFNSIKKL